MLDSVKVDPFPHLERWPDAVGQRPATLKADELAKSYNRALSPTEVQQLYNLGTVHIHSN
jgi:hypothetical protein